MWLKKCVFICSYHFDSPETFTGTRVVEPDGRSKKANYLKKVECAGGNTLERFCWLFERETDRTLTGQVIDFVWLAAADRLQHASEIVGCHGDSFNPV